MSQTEAHIQQFIETGQLELAYQLLLSLDSSDAIQAFMDIVERSLPDNADFHHAFSYALRVHKSNLVWEWKHRFRIVTSRQDLDHFIKVQDIPKSSEKAPYTFGEIHIYGRTGRESLLNQVYEIIALNAEHILAKS